MARNILKSSMKQASFSIVFQVVFRCISFVLNAFIIRHVGQEVLGIMNVRLLLLESTILFLSKEPLLKACLSDTKSHNWAQVFNQIWLSVPVSAVLGLVLSYIWINLLSSTEDKYLSQYQMGCYAIAFSCIIDQITQCVALVAQSFCFVKLKVVFDTTYILIRTATFVILVLKYPNSAIYIFSIAQVVSSLAYCLMYYGFFWWYIKKLNKLRSDDEKNSQHGLPTHSQKTIFFDMLDFKFKSIRDLLPGQMQNKESPLNTDLFRLTISFAKQSMVKQVLTEGERYVMTISPVLTFTEQSMYDIVNNLGSLAARFLFRPIEESAYFYFTQMIRRETPLIEQDKSKVRECSYVLTNLCKVVTCIGLIVVVFGQSYSHTLLYLYGGRVLTDSPLPDALLRCHCCAVLLLAANGVTECYVFATMDTKQLNRYNYVMVIFSISFLLISFVLTSLIGPIGFIIANCINMTARTIHSVKFINKQYELLNYSILYEARPDLWFIVALVTSGIVTKLSEMYFFDISLIIHIGIGGICFIVTVLVWAFENRNLLRTGVERYRRLSSVKLD